MPYHASMSTTIRPIDCCETSNQHQPAPLAGGERDRLVAMFKALGDPTQLDVFRLIVAQEEPLCVCEVVARFNVSQPTISHHLKVLREAGLISVSRRGVWAYYAPNPHGVALLREALATFAPSLLATAG